MTSPPGWWSSARGREVDLGALGAPDPVRLLDPDRGRPVDAVELEQLVRVGGRPQEPLLEVALLDERAAAPAAAIGSLDLLARERAVVGAPVDRRHRPIGHAGLEESQEQPLVPLVVGGVGGDDLGLPGEHRAHRLELATHRLDVLHRPGERVAAALDGRVLGRQPERVEPDREEHVVAMHPTESRERVGRRHDVPVADVQVTRRVRVHRQLVPLGPRVVAQVRLVHPELGPARLPARLDRGRVVAFDPGSCVGRHGPIVPDNRGPVGGSGGAGL